MRTDLTSRVTAFHLYDQARDNLDSKSRVSYNSILYIHSNQACSFPLR